MKNKFWKCAVICLAIAGTALIGLFGCAGEKKGTVQEKAVPVLNVTENTVTLGLKDQHSWSFVKKDGVWKMDGVLVDGKKAFEFGDGTFFRFACLSFNTNNPQTIIDNTIHSLEVIKDTAEEKSIKVKNGQSYMVLTATSKSTFISREIGITTPVDNKFTDYQIMFGLRSVDGVYDSEMGAIATKNYTETQAKLPYAFPAVYSQLQGFGVKTNFVNVINYNETADEFKSVRKQKVRDVFELGAGSVNSDIKAATTLVFKDELYINNRSGEDYYSLIGKAADRFFEISPLPAGQLSKSGNINAGSFEQLANGLYFDVTDKRTMTEQFMGAMTAYGYQEDADGGWGESFAMLDVAKGLTRYSRYTKDTVVMNTALSMVKVLVESQQGKDWIARYSGENSKGNEYFLQHTYTNGGFGVNSSGEETGNVPGISTWKYYDMLANLGEIALYSESQELKTGFLKLMPFFNTLKMEGYVQPVAWYYSNRLPASGYENGGSGGAAAMWGYIHLLASEISADSVDKEFYKQEGLKSIEHANTLDYFSMYAMRVAAKPTAIGWAVKANVKAYEMTENAKYLDRAKHVVKSIASFYYLNTNPYTFFPSIGFGYADLRERWEAYFEMATGLWLTLDVMQYTPTDTTMLNLYYAASRTHQWAFPINGDAYGNPSRNYDSLDGHYIPFEFTTGILSDNPGGEGGSQTNLRQIKEIYGSGETFLEYLMYEAWADSNDKELLTLCLSGANNRFSDTEHKFIVYNAGTANKNSHVRFKNFAEGDYTVTADGKKIGVYSNEALQNGVRLQLNAGQAQTVEVKKTGSKSAEKTIAKPLLNITEVQSGSALLTAEGNSSLYRFEVSKYPSFPSNNTKAYVEEGKAKQIFFDDGAELYARVRCLDDGKSSEFSDVKRIEGKSAVNLAVDNFSSGLKHDSWIVTGGDVRGDYHQGMFYSAIGISNMLKAEKTFIVDGANAEIFEIRFITKNLFSEINVYLTYNGNKIKAIGPLTQIEEGYLRADLKALNLGYGALNAAPVTVTIESTGKNKGFALDYVRFIKEGAHESRTAFLNNTMTNEFNELTKGDSLTIVNDAQPSFTGNPSIDVSFNPLKLPILEISLSGYKAIDTLTINVKNQQGTVFVNIKNVNITNAGGKLSYDLTAAPYNVTAEGEYNFSYSVSNDRVKVDKMQLIGQGSKTEAVTKANGFADGASAHINADDEIRLNPGIIYNYGDVRKKIKVNMSETPIVFFDIAQLSGSWAVKIVPSGAAGDIRLTPDSSETGIHAFDLRTVIDSDGETEITFVIFIIGASSGDTSAYLKMNPIRFGDSLSLVAEKADEVISSITYDVGNINVDKYGYISINVESLSKNAKWKLILTDNETNRSVEMKTALERKYTKRYCREKQGRYIYDIKEIAKYSGIKDLSVKVVLVGNSAQCKIGDVSFTSSNMIPVQFVG